MVAQNVVFGILAAVMVLAGWKVVTTQNVVRAQAMIMSSASKAKPNASA